MDHRLLGSSVHGAPQVRILEWVAMPSSRGSSWPRDLTRFSYVSYISRQVLYHKCHLGSLNPAIVTTTTTKIQNLGCFHVLAMTNSAAMNIGVHVSLSDLVSLVCMPRSGIAGSYGSSISSFLRDLQNLTSLHNTNLFVDYAILCQRWRENFLRMME